MPNAAEVSVPIRRAAEHLARDVAYALRALRRAPLFTAIVGLILAVGIGANSAAIGLVDAMYLRKLPVPQPDRVVAVYSGDLRARGALHDGGTTFATYHRLVPLIRGVSGFAEYAMQDLPAGGELAGSYTRSALVTGNYFQVLGIVPERGRFILPDDVDGPGAHPVAVISDYVWRESFAAQNDVIGRQIPIGTVTYTIIGVAPPHFTGLHPEGRTNLWIPYTMDAKPASLVGTVFGRLAPGATLAEVQASADVAARELTVADPIGYRRLTLTARVRDRLTTAELSFNGLSFMLLGCVMIALLHLVACTNVASLMLARAAARRRELGVRICLGASRTRILMQSLTEALVLGAVGAMGGVAIATVISRLLATMQFLSASDPRLDGRVVAIVAVVLAGTVVQFGLIPAFEASRTDPLDILRGARGRARGSRRDRSEIVVLAQVAVSLMLITNAVVFLSLTHRQAADDPGYDATHLLVARVDLADGHSAPKNWPAAADDALARVAATPGVRAAALAVGAPLFDTRWFGEVTPSGRPALADMPAQTSLQAIGPGYFATLGTPLVRGREFTGRDRLAPGASHDAFDVAIVNETLARRLWPSGNALGQLLTVAGAHGVTVVGVVRDAHDVSSVGFAPRVYLPLLERGMSTFDIVVRTAAPAERLAGDVRAAIAGSAIATSGVAQRPEVRTMDGIREGATSAARGAAAGFSICGALALLLTAVGLYGIVAMWAAQRRPEIGIRLALGATARDVHRLLLGGIGKVLGTGALLGVACAFGMVQVERGMMGPMVSLDPLVVGTSALVLALCGGIAVYLPSRRAARQHPADVLRSSL